MLSFVGMTQDGRYRVVDSEDGAVDVVSYEELFDCVVNLGLTITGVIFSKRLGRLLCEQIRGGKGYTKSTSFFKEEVYNLVGDDYSVLSEYKTSRDGVRFRHNVCGFEYSQEPRLFLDGKRCPKCFRLAKDTTAGFKSFVQSVVGDEYSVETEYKGANDYITFRHKKCGKLFSMAASSFKRGQRCPHCAFHGVPVRSFSEVAAKVKARSEEYELLAYNGSNALARLRHLVCGTEFDMRPYTFLHQNGRCPVCRRSVPERLIQLELEKWFSCEFNIWPRWLKEASGYRLELDIYIPSIKTAVEYDSFGFHIDRVHNDTFKDINCAKCGVRMIRVREHDLPVLNSSSIQIVASKQFHLSRGEGIEIFEDVVTQLLSHLGVVSTYKVDRNVLQTLYNNSLLPGRR